MPVRGLHQDIKPVRYRDILCANRVFGRDHKRGYQVLVLTQAKDSPVLSLTSGRLFLDDPVDVPSQLVR